ncbi:MAG: response regulator transcription factor [Spirosomataceae bacterium]
MTTTILIIDDHQLFNDGLALILKEAKDFKIVGQVYDSRQALYQCQTFNPDVVLVDFNMPYLDGLEVVKQLKAYAFKCKVVVISMYADSRELMLFKELGVNGFLPKTTPAGELRAALRDIVAGEQVFKSISVDKPESIKDDFVLKYRLSKREVEILKALKEGNTSEQVAERLHLSYFTVQTHRRNINQKLNIKTQQDLFDFLKDFND